jgi:hypothetical protein
VALNTYCRAFSIPPAHLLIRCPEGQILRFACFDPAELAGFDLHEIAGWFKHSSERMYARTPPPAEFEVPVSLAPRSSADRSVRSFETELIPPTSYPAEPNPSQVICLHAFNRPAGLPANFIQGRKRQGRVGVDYTCQPRP